MSELIARSRNQRSQLIQSSMQRQQLTVMLMHMCRRSGAPRSESGASAAAELVGEDLPPALLAVSTYLQLHTRWGKAVSKSTQQECA